MNSGLRDRFRNRWWHRLLTRFWNRSWWWNRVPETSSHRLLRKKTEDSSFYTSFTKLHVWGFAYAATLITVGVIGYVIGYAKADSTLSLKMGLLFGSLSAIGSYQISVHPRYCGLLFCSSGYLTLLMGYRTFNSGNSLPAGLVAVISLLTALRLSPIILA